MIPRKLDLATEYKIALRYAQGDKVVIIIKDFSITTGLLYNILRRLKVPKRYTFDRRSNRDQR